MDAKIDIRQALRVFHILTSQGTHQDGEYVLNGLRAFTDFDGYTITISNDYVSLDIFFHNTYRFNGSDAKEKVLFLQKLREIDRSFS